MLPQFEMISFILSMLIGGKLIIILWITTEIRSYHEYDNEMEQGDWLIWKMIGRYHILTKAKHVFWLEESTQQVYNER